MRFALATLLIVGLVECSMAQYVYKSAPPPPPPCTPPSYGKWGSWSRCRKSCGDEDQTRTRYCDRGNCPGEYRCKGSAPQQKQSCGHKCCKVDGKWSSWKNAGECSKTCGGGYRYRKRECRGQDCGGSCRGNARERVSCNGGCCPKNGYFTQWGRWGRCTKTCGGGTRLRARRCEGRECGGKGCFGHVGDRQACGEKCCPVDARISRWSSWGSCSKECNGGYQSRTRNCVEGKCGGEKCPRGFEKSESRRCNTGCCKVNGGWSSWRSWSKPSVTCGSCQRTRSRYCNRPRPSCKGRGCNGKSSDSKSCNLPACKVQNSYYQG